ncbi:hypothetical protein ACSS6W_003825 [Trichoderma asperelloides]
MMLIEPPLDVLGKNARGNVDARSTSTEQPVICCRGRTAWNCSMARIQFIPSCMHAPPLPLRRSK